MEKGELTTINEDYRVEMAIAKPSGVDYKVTTPHGEVKLKRDVDFGVIPKTDRPTLLKSGAERIALAYGLCQQYEIVEHIEQFGKEPFFYYLVKCNLVIPNNNGGILFSCGYGSANTAESNAGFGNPYNLANTAVKKAQKRALVHAALAISGLSSMFYADLDDTKFMNQANDLAATMKEDAPITAKQMRRVYALAANAGLTANEAKQKIVAAGFASTKDIKQKDYEKVCGLFEDKE